MGPLFFYFDRCHFHSNGGSRTGYFFKEDNRICKSHCRITIMWKCIFLKNCQFNGLKKTGNFLLICRDKNNKDAKNIYRKFLKFQIQMNLKMINPTI